MSWETVVALHVTDEDLYRQYREAMTPLLHAHDGGFRFDVRVGEVLRSDATHPINRMFAIFFGSRAQMDAFFAHPEYRAIRARLFEPAVAGTTILGGYER